VSLACGRPDGQSRPTSVYRSGRVLRGSTKGRGSPAEAGEADVSHQCVGGIVNLDRGCCERSAHGRPPHDSAASHNQKKTVTGSTRQREAGQWHSQHLRSKQLECWWFVKLALGRGPRVRPSWFSSHQPYGDLAGSWIAVRRADAVSAASQLIGRVLQSAGAANSCERLIMPSVHDGVAESIRLGEDSIQTGAS